MKKNAFTLIELIAVIVILSLIALVVFPAVNSTLKTSKEKAYKEQENAIIKAAKSCSYENTFILPDDASTTIVVPLKCFTVGCKYNEIKSVKDGTTAFLSYSDSYKLNGGYLNYETSECAGDSKITNPRNTKKCLTGNVKITYETSKKQYTYKYEE